MLVTLVPFELEKTVELAEGSLDAKCHLSHFYSGVGRLAFECVAMFCHEFLSLAPLLVHSGLQLSHRSLLDRFLLLFGRILVFEVRLTQLFADASCLWEPNFTHRFVGR